MCTLLRARQSTCFWGGSGVKRSWQLIWLIVQLLCFTCSQWHKHQETCHGWVGVNWIWPRESNRGPMQPKWSTNVLLGLIERCPFNLASHLHPASNSHGCPGSLITLRAKLQREKCKTLGCYGSKEIVAIKNRSPLWRRDSIFISMNIRRW